MFAVYFIIFCCAIKFFHVPVNKYLGVNRRATSKRNEQARINYIARSYIEALGGKENILKLFACTTRLRIVVNNAKLVSQEQIRETGALGVSKIGNSYVQIVVGMGVDDIYGEIASICNKA
ncbi:MAG: PTS transporter subunit EIIB [Oscillospiraceae bacterium]